VGNDLDLYQYLYNLQTGPGICHRQSEVGSAAPDDHQVNDPRPHQDGCQV